MRSCIIALLALAAAAAGCTGGSPAGSVPRPTAYPRAALYDTVYALRGLPAHFQVNASAVVEFPGGDSARNAGAPLWADIRYPAYNAVLHCTFTPVADDESRRQVVDNRTERMALNLGYNTAEQTEITAPSGAVSVILTSTGQTLTPVQFISSTEKWVVSGAMMFDRDSVSTDSVLPMIKAVRTDLIKACREIK